MSRINMRQNLASFTRNKQGLAALEVALSLPLMVVLCLGGFELARYTLINMKMEKVAFTLADVTAQNETLTNAQINDIFGAAQHIADPFPMNTLGVAYITSAYRAQGAAYPTVRWQRSGAGNAVNASQVGSTGLTATLPGGLTVNERDNVIIAEVYYQYQPLFAVGLIGSKTIYKTTVFKPRLGDLTTSPT